VKAVNKAITAAQTPGTNTGTTPEGETPVIVVPLG